MTAAMSGQAAYEVWRAAIPDWVCNVPAGPWDELSPAVQAGFAAIAAQLQDGTAPELDGVTAERDRFWNALFYIACRAPEYVPYAGPECVQVAKDAIEGTQPPPADE